MLAAARPLMLDRAATAQMSVAVCNCLADPPVGRVGDCLADVDGPGGNSDVDWLTSRDCSVDVESAISRMCDPGVGYIGRLFGRC